MQRITSLAFKQEKGWSGTVWKTCSILPETNKQIIFYSNGKNPSCSLFLGLCTLITHYLTRTWKVSPSFHTNILIKEHLNAEASWACSASELERQNRANVRVHILLCFCIFWHLTTGTESYNIFLSVSQANVCDSVNLSLPCASYFKRHFITSTSLNLRGCKSSAKRLPTSLPARTVFKVKLPTQGQKKLP